MTTCNQVEAGNQVGEASGAGTAFGAVTAAWNNSLASGNGVCGGAGVCSGLNQQCGFVATGGSITVRSVEGPDGKVTFDARAVTQGRCECKSIAAGT